MLKYYFLIILLFHSVVHFAQTEFSQTIDTDSLGASIGISLQYVESDETLIIQSDNACYGTTCAGLNKIDLEGNLLWHQIYSDAPNLMAYDDHPGSLLINTNGEIVTAGTRYTTASTLQNYFLLLTDSEGDSLWLKTYPNAGPDLAKVLAQMPDGGYLIGGTNGNFSERSIRLIRTNSEGNIIWEKEYADSFQISDIFSIINHNDGNILLSGQVIQLGADNGDGYISKLSDTDGTILWEDFWGTSENECPLYIDFSQNEQTYVGAWCVDNNPNVDSDETNKIRKIDFDLNTIWEYDFEPVNDVWRFIYNIKALEDGSVLGLGRLRDNAFFNQMEFDYNKLMWEMAWLFKLSPNGELAWERVFFDSEYVHFYTIYDMLQTPDGSIYTVGQTTDSLVIDNGDGTFQQIYDQNIWLTRFDENGCFNGDCGPPDGGYWDLSDQINVPVLDVASSKPFVVYPNPSAGLFRLRYEGQDLAYRVLDVSGRLVLAGSGKEVDLSGQSTGVYFLQLYEDGAMLGGERIAVFK